MAFLDDVARYRIADTPVGAGALVFASIGIGEAVGGVVQRFIPLGLPMTQVGLGFLVRNLDMIRDFLGDAGSDIVSMAMVGNGIDSLIGLRSIIRGALAGLTGGPAIAAGKAASAGQSIGQAKVVPLRERVFVSELERKISGVRV